MLSLSCVAHNLACDRVRATDGSIDVVCNDTAFDSRFNIIPLEDEAAKLLRMTVGEGRWVWKIFQRLSTIPENYGVGIVHSFIDASRRKSGLCLPNHKIV
jgi:hypothetical protein